MAALQSIVQDDYPEILKSVQGETFRAKLGLASWDTDASDHLMPQLQALLAKSNIDYTLFYRQLAEVSTAEARAAVESGVAAQAASADIEAAEAAALPAADPMLAHLAPAMYNGMPEGGLLKEWRRWLSRYAQKLAADGRDEAERRAEMRATSPKYVPREWMLAAAYTKAEKGDFSVLHELLEVLTSPFDEHTPEIAAKYYRRPPTELEKKAGLAYFS